jgi:hypothetical protein
MSKAEINGDGGKETNESPKSTDLETHESTMNKVKVTFAIRVPKDMTNFAPAKMHIDALHEIHKHDKTTMIFNSSGDTKINVKEPMSDTKYKELFNPVEKQIG